MTEILFARKSDLDALTALVNAGVVTSIVNDTNITGTISSGVLTFAWAGTLANARGGTGTGTYTTGDILVASATDTLSKLAGNTTTTRKFLRQTGNGTISAAPAWDTILAADVPGSALTKTDDTNVTLTLGGSPNTALLNAASITVGWTGTLAVTRGGTGGGSASGTLLDNITGFASTGIIVRTGAGAYAFRTATGTANRVTVTNGDGVAGNQTFDISAAYVGQSSITTLGTIGTGTWQGTVVGGTYGGTGVNNGASTITLGGNFATSGAFSTTLTVTATTNSTLPSGTHTLAGLDVAQTWSANQQFNSGNFILKGSTSGTLTVKPAATAGANTLTLPAGTTDFSATGGSNQYVKQTSSGGAFTVAVIASGDLPAFGSGDVSFASGGGAGTIANNAVTNAKAAQMAAFTIKGNATGSTANATDIVIGNLTLKASPASSDIVLIQDEAASHALKYTTVSALASAGSVASFNARTGVVVPTAGDYTYSGNTVALPRSYLAGMGTALNGVSPNTKVDVTAGATRDDTDAFNIVFSGSHTINAGTTGADALDTGALANNTWYHIFAIAKADGTVAALASTSISSPTFPSGYIYKRRLWSVRTDGSAHFIPYAQTGDMGYWSTSRSDYSSTVGTSPSLIALSTPTGVKCTAWIRASFSRASAFAYGIITSPDSNSETPNTPLANITMVSQASGGQVAEEIRVLTDTSSQVRATADAATTNRWLITYAWQDRRGRDD